MSTPDPAIHISQPDVAKLCGVSRVTLWRWMHKKPWIDFPKPVLKLPSKPGSKVPEAGRVFFDRAEVEAWRARHQLARAA